MRCPFRTPPSFAAAAPQRAHTDHKPMSLQLLFVRWRDSPPIYNTFIHQHKTVRFESEAMTNGTVISAWRLGNDRIQLELRGKRAVTAHLEQQAIQTCDVWLVRVCF